MFSNMIYMHMQYLNFNVFVEQQIAEPSHDERKEELVEDSENDA